MDQLTTNMQLIAAAVFSAPAAAAAAGAAVAGAVSVFCNKCRYKHGGACKTCTICVAAGKPGFGHEANTCRVGKTVEQLTAMCVKCPICKKLGYSKNQCPTCGPKKDPKPLGAAIPAVLQGAVLPAGFHFMGTTLPISAPKRSYELPSFLQVTTAILGVLIGIIFIIYSINSAFKPSANVPLISRTYGTIGAMRAKSTLFTSLNDTGASGGTLKHEEDFYTLDKNAPKIHFQTPANTIITSQGYGLQQLHMLNIVDGKTVDVFIPCYNWFPDLPND